MKKLFLIMLMLCGMARAQNTTVYFDFDSYALTEEAKAVLDSAYAEIKYYTLYNFEIQGFTDERGADTYNDTLALRRAQTVEAYIKQLNPYVGSKVASKRVSHWKPEISDKQKRCVTINGQKMAGCGYYPEYEFAYTAENGVIVKAGNFRARTGNPDRPVITTSFSSEEMIKNNRYGVDVNGNVLKSWGMIDIKGGESDDGMFTVMVPITGTPDPNMSIWLPGDEYTDNVKWKDTNIAIEIDPTGKYYVFKVPVSASGNTRVNLDMPCGFRPEKPRNNFKNGKAVVYKTVYISTDKPYDFYRVHSAYKEKSGFSMSFSAKINDTLYAFTVAQRIHTKGMQFFGWEKASGKIVAFRLNRCDFRQDKAKNDYYAMNENTLAVPKKKTGLWAWFSRLFKNS